MSQGEYTIDDAVLIEEALSFDIKELEDLLYKGKYEAAGVSKRPLADAAGADAAAEELHAPTGKKKRPSQSEAQRRYREKQKQRVVELEQQLVALQNKVYELENAAAAKSDTTLVNGRDVFVVGAAAAAPMEIAIKEEEGYEPPPSEAEVQVMKERLKQEMGRLVEKLREGYWVDDDETLWEKLKEIGDACKRFKQANPKYEDQNLCGRLSAEAIGYESELIREHWKRVLRVAEFGPEAIRGATVWREKLMASLTEMHKERLVALETLRAQSDPGSSTGSGCYGNLLEGTRESLEAVAFIHRSINKQKEFIWATVCILLRDVLGPRASSRAFLSSWPVLMDPVALVNAMAAQLDGTLDEGTSGPIVGFEGFSSGVSAQSSATVGDM